MNLALSRAVTQTLLTDSPKHSMYSAIKSIIIKEATCLAYLHSSLGTIMPMQALPMWELYYALYHTMTAMTVSAMSGALGRFIGLLWRQSSMSGIRG